MSLTHLSLFSGFGGLDLAAEHAGIETVGQCEWADYPRQVLEKHWPDIPRWRDIRTLTGESFHERTGLRTVDLISGGFPCQPFSVAGQRKGTDDDRYLWPEMLRVISEIRPTWVVGENVAGLISMAEPLGGFEVESRTIARLSDCDMYDAISSRQERMLLNGIIEEICAIGYDVQTFCIPACGVGANHQRYRIAIMGYADSKRRAELDDAAVDDQQGQPGRGRDADVSNADSGTCRARRPEPTGQQRETGTGNGGADVPDTTRERCGEAWQYRERSEKRIASGGIMSDPDRAERRTERKPCDRLAERPHCISQREESAGRSECGGEAAADAASGGLQIAELKSGCNGWGHAARNSLPSLLDELDSKDQEIARLTARCAAMKRAIIQSCGACRTCVHGTKQWGGDNCVNEEHCSMKRKPGTPYFVFDELRFTAKEETQS